MRLTIIPPTKRMNSRWSKRDNNCRLRLSIAAKVQVHTPPGAGVPPAGVWDAPRGGGKIFGWSERININPATLAWDEDHHVAQLGDPPIVIPHVARLVRERIVMAMWTHHEWQPVGSQDEGIAERSATTFWPVGNPELWVDVRYGGDSPRFHIGANRIVTITRRSGNHIDPWAAHLS